MVYYYSYWFVIFLITVFPVLCSSSKFFDFFKNLRSDDNTQYDESNIGSHNEVSLYNANSPLPANPTLAYDENYAQELLSLSAGAYAVSPDDCINRAFPAYESWKKSLYHSDKCDMMEILCSFYSVVSPQRRQIVIVFRGTRNVTQLMGEVFSSILPPVDFDNNLGQVNQYFLNGLNVLWNVVERVLRIPAYKDYDVAFTGHSLGGALASLAIFRTVLQKLRSSNQVVLYSFGQPRVGNPAYARAFNQYVPNSFRVVNGYDVVPHMPSCLDNAFHKKSKPCDPSNEDSHYHHGIEIWYPDGMEEGNSYRECRGQPYGEDFSCSNQKKVNLLKISEYLDDHRHYFGHKVPAFGKFGCVSDPREETLANSAMTGDDWRPPSNTGFSGFINKAKNFGKMLTSFSHLVRQNKNHFTIYDLALY